MNNSDNQINVENIDNDNTNENNNLQEMLKNLAENNDIGNLINQFSSSLNSFENEHENNIDVETDEYSDYDENMLDKYLINKDGKNISDILSEINNQLIELNKNLCEKK